MKTRKLTFDRLTFEQVPATFDGLIKLHAPRPIHDEVGYKNTVEMVDALAGHPLNKDQEDYLLLLSALVERYEADTLPKRPRVTGLAMLRYLLAVHDEIRPLHEEFQQRIFLRRQADRPSGARGRVIAGVQNEVGDAHQFRPDLARPAQ